jgi:hypothetical protein
MLQSINNGGTMSDPISTNPDSIVQTLVNCYVGLHAIYVAIWPLIKKIFKIGQ